MGKQLGFSYAAETFSSAGLVKVMGSKRKGDATLVLNEFGECLGFGRIMSELAGSEGKVAVRNVLDVGDFLRREAKDRFNSSVLISYFERFTWFFSQLRQNIYGLCSERLFNHFRDKLKYVHVLSGFQYICFNMVKSMDEQVKKAIETLKSNNIRWVHSAFVDIRGILQDMVLPAREYLNGAAFTEGVGFDGSSVQRF